MPDDIPYGYCQCGCGEKTNIAATTHSTHGYVKGEPRRYLNGHANRIDLRVRFEAKVDRRSGQGPNGDCHIWTGSPRCRQGYGGIRYQGKQRLAHRVAWFLEYGVWPEPCALHRCDTPACVNVEHLFLGTIGDNVRDCVAKGRHKATPRLGEANPSTKLTPADVLEIRALEGLESQAAIGRRFGVCRSTIDAILKGRTWRHV